jgi:heavy metal sensor kinase
MKADLYKLRMLGGAIKAGFRASIRRVRPALAALKGWAARKVRAITPDIPALIRKARIITKRTSRARFKSLRFRISALYIASLGFILLTYSIVLYLSLSYAVYRQVDRELAVKAQGLEDTVRAYTATLKPNQEDIPGAIERALYLEEAMKGEFFAWPTIKKIDLEWKNKIADLGLRYDYILILNPVGEVINKSPNVEDYIVSALKKDLPETIGSKPVIKNYISGNLKLRIIKKTVLSNNNVQYIILLATSLEPLLFILKNKMTHFFIIIPFVLLIATFLGGFFVRRVFDPIKEIIRTADNISHKDMSKRIQQRYKDVEIKSLVSSFNDMISRLEKPFGHIETFSSNVAHELKTPLAIIRGESEVVLRKKRAAGEYERVVRVNLEESHRMLKTIDDLLLLTKLDYQPQNFKFERFNIVEFFHEIHEQSQLIALEKKIEISLDISSGPVYLNGNKLQLRRLFFNLINNAIKFTPKNGSITIKAMTDSDKLNVTVSDTGIGIAKEDLTKIFDRFFHRDSTGWNKESANGLGLSIVQSILNMHRGSIEVRSELGKGSAFTVRLPLS